MSTDSIRKLLRRVWHGNEHALEQCAETIIQAVKLEVRMQLRDAQLWSRVPHHALPRKLLKTLLGQSESAPGDAPQVESIGQMVRRLIENRAKALALSAAPRRS